MYLGLGNWMGRHRLWRVHKSRCPHSRHGLQSHARARLMSHNGMGRRRVQNQSWRQSRVLVHPRSMILMPCWTMRSGTLRTSPSHSKAGISETSLATCSFYGYLRAPTGAEGGFTRANMYCTSSERPIYRSAERIMLGSFDFGRSEL